MKKILLVILVAMITSMGCQTTNQVARDGQLKVGDDVVAFFDAKEPKYLVEGKRFLNMPEGYNSYLKFVPEGIDERPVLLVCENLIIGALQKDGNKTTLLYDLDGDNKLDAYLSTQIVPAWVLAKSEHTKKSSTNNVKPYLDQLYNLFNDNSDPYKSGALTNKIKEMFLKSFDVNTPNRDILYAVGMYYNFLSEKQPGIDIGNASVAAELYKDRFKPKNIPALFYLQVIETLINIDETAEAIKSLNYALELYPQFIPFQVYDWQLETDSTKKEVKYKELKRKYPNHWIIKQI